VKSITEIDDPRLVKALAHPIRISILRILETRVASPSSIAEELGAPVGNVSYHVRALARVGLVELANTVPRRGAVEHFYRSCGRVSVTDTAWAEVPGIVKAGLVDSALGHIGELVAAAAVNGGFELEHSVLVRQSLKVDEEGFRAIASAAAEFLDRLTEIERESAERIAARGPHTEPEMSVCVAMMVFESADAPAQPRDGKTSKRRGLTRLSEQHTHADRLTSSA
jgi:DNA-binding transcriptional ArsR family regulator